MEVFEVTDARVLGPDAHPVARGDQLLTDGTWTDGTPFPLSRSSVMRRRRPYPKIRLPGTTALIASNWSVGSFGHFLTDALTRWPVMLAAGFKPEDFDTILVYHTDTQSTRYILNRLGLPGLITALPDHDYCCEKLVFTTFPNVAPKFTPELLSWVRSICPPLPGRRRVYLSRSGYPRNPMNGTEIESYLAAQGFEKIEGADHLGALQACREAEVILGVEGSNFFNAAFAAPGTRLVELLWTGCKQAFVPALGAALGFPTGVVPALPTAPMESPEFPLEAVKRAIEWALGSAS